MGERTLNDLNQKQALPLNVKIALSRERIRQWINEYGEEGAYISFSGGKDSTVLVDLVRNVCGYKNVPAVFVDVPTQYPELKQFAQTFDNVIILKPKISFAKVCEKYGFPIISKEVSASVCDSRKYIKKYLTKHDISDNAATDRQTDRQIRYYNAIADILGIDRRIDKDNENFQAIKKGIIPEEFIQRMPAKAKILFGVYPEKKEGKLTGELSKKFDKSKYRFFLDAPFEISDMCCKVMKKAPLKAYAAETGRNPMTGQMAAESYLRTAQWIKHGCNLFDSKHPISNPMSFWTEQDILHYIHERDIKICSVYGKVVEDFGDELEGQMSFEDFGLYEKQKKLKCTGCSRTGCVLCGFGCHLESKEEARFLKLKETHPKFYALLDVFKNSGYTFRQALEWTNENMQGKGHIYF